MATRGIRPVRVHGNIAFVPLSKGYEAIIDVCDVHLVAGFNWCARVHGRTVYAVRKEYSLGKTRNVHMHRLIAGTRDGFCADHIDGNGLNNRRKNIRSATSQQNAQNQRVAINNRSGFKGVTWASDRKKWRATIAVDGRNVGLGQFDNKEDAHAAYQKAAAMYFGEFARP